MEEGECPGNVQLGGEPRDIHWIMLYYTYRFNIILCKKYYIIKNTHEE